MGSFRVFRALRVLEVLSRPTCRVKFYSINVPGFPDAIGRVREVIVLGSFCTLQAGLFWACSVTCRKLRWVGKPDVSAMPALCRCRLTTVGQSGGKTASASAIRLAWSGLNWPLFITAILISRLVGRRHIGTVGCQIF